MEFIYKIIILFIFLYRIFSLLRARVDGFMFYILIFYRTDDFNITKYISKFSI